MSSSSSSKLSYKRLKHEFIFEDDDDFVTRRPRISWTKKLKKIKLTRRKFKIRIRISRLRNFFTRRRKRPKVQLSWAKIVRRLKDSQAHFGDLFSGNYLFMQVTPTALKGNKKDKVIMATQGLDHDLHGLFSNYGVGKKTYAS